MLSSAENSWWLLLLAGIGGHRSRPRTKSWLDFSSIQGHCYQRSGTSYVEGSPWEA